MKRSAPALLLTLSRRGGEKVLSRTLDFIFSSNLHIEPKFYQFRRIVGSANIIDGFRTRLSTILRNRKHDVQCSFANPLSQNCAKLRSALGL